MSLSILRQTIRLLLILLLFPLSALAQENQYRPTIIIDFAQLDRQRTQAVVEALAVAQDQDSWTSVVIQRDDTLFGIIARRYRFSDALYPQLAERLATLIGEVNGFSPQNLPVGEPLRIPLLAQRPLTLGARDTITQWIDLTSKAAFVARSSALTEGNVPGKTVGELKEASTWTTTVSATEFDAFITALPSSERSEILAEAVYAGPRDEVGFFGVAPGLSETIAPAVLAPMELASLKSVTPDFVGKYYILDFFSDDATCDHGDLVMDAARRTLRQFGKEGWSTQLVPVNLDFFANRDFALGEIDKYVSRQGPSIREVLKVVVESVRNMRRPRAAAADRPHVVPLLYLQALYSNLIAASDTDVVSSSFWTLFDGYRVTPISYGSDSTIPLLSAVLDDASSSIEDFTNREPLRSFYEGRHDLGFVLVGASLPAGGILGMSSRHGDGVTVIAEATVVGESGACRGIVRSGTSFATPVVGAQALMAKAYWKSRKQSLSAVALKRRLLLAGQRVPSYVGRFASGGIPNFAELLLDSGPIGIDHNDRAVALAVAENISYIEIESVAGGVPDRLVFRKGVNGFSGLEFSADAIFVYSDGWRHWKKVNVVGLHFVSQVGVPAIASIAELARHFKKVVLL